MDRPHQAIEILDIVEDERAVGEIEARLRQHEMIEICDPIIDRRVVRILSCPRDHVFGKVQSEDVVGTVLARPTGKPTEAAAEVDHAETFEVRQYGPDRRPFGGAVEPVHGPRELAVAREEFGFVVDILCHLSVPPKARRVQTASCDAI